MDTTDRDRQTGAAVDAWAHKRWGIGGGSALGWLAAILVLLLVMGWGVIVIGVPQNPADELAPLATRVALPQAKPTEDALEPKDRLALQRDLIQNAADSRIKTWTLIAQVIGAAVLAIGGYFTWRNLRVTQERLDVDRQGQITERFTKAIEQLGAEKEGGEPNLEVRLGGIYALERIARDSPRDHWTIMEVLTTYLRQNAPWQPPPMPATLDTPPCGETPDTPKLRADFQAILTVLARRTPPQKWREPGPLDLRRTDLGGASLLRANLRKEANLRKAILEETNLQRADLQEANLQGANLRGANLQEANLREVNLYGAKLWRANLCGVNLTGAKLSKASLGTANLQAAILRSANLQAASLRGTNLKATILDDADLSDADLSQDQLKSAASHRGARLPQRLADLEEAGSN